MSITEPKIDPRPRRNGWCPGDYLRTCPTCKEYFIGDKRASRCADCAYKPQAPYVSDTPETDAVSNAILLHGQTYVAITLARALERRCFQLESELKLLKGESNVHKTDEAAG